MAVDEVKVGMGFILFIYDDDDDRNLILLDIEAMLMQKWRYKVAKV